MHGGGRSRGDEPTSPLVGGLRGHHHHATTEAVSPGHGHDFALSDIEGLFATAEMRSHSQEQLAGEATPGGAAGQKLRKAPPAGGVQTDVPEEEAPGGGATPATSASMKAAIGGMSPSKDRRSSIAMLDAVLDERPDGGSPSSFIYQRWFTLGVYTAIFLNAGQMGLKVDVEGEPWDQVWDAMEHAFGVVFLLGMFCKLYVLRWGYWQDPWNRLDALLVGLTILDLWILTDLPARHRDAAVLGFADPPRGPARPDDPLPARLSSG